MYQRTDLEKNHERRRTSRRREEPMWRQLAELFRPDDVDFELTDRDRDDAELFDSTGLYAVDTFQGGIFGQLTNPANRWFELTLQDEERARYRPVKDWLYRTTNLIYSSLSPGVSSFYTQVPAWFANLGIFGNGYFSQIEIIGEQSISDRAHAVGQCYVERDAIGRLNDFDLRYKRTGKQIGEFFERGDYNPQQLREDGSYTLVHSVCRNRDFRQGRIGAQNLPWLSYYWSPDLPSLWRPRGYWEMPYHAIGWNTRDGRDYDTGPGHNARPDAATLNEMERSHLVGGQFMAEPPILVHSETALTAADVVPNAVLEGAVTADGKPLVQVLERKQQLQVSLTQSEQKRNAIRAAFYYTLMQLVQRPQMTATEFLGFQSEILKLMAPNLVRIQHNGLSPFIGRRFRMLQRSGQLDAFVGPPPPELQGRLDIEYVSPLAKVQKQAKAQGVLGWVGQMGKIAAESGQPDVWDNVDVDVVASVTADAMTEVPAVARDPRAVAQIRQGRAQAQERQMQVEQAGQVADVIATVSHAQQAKTLSDKRAASQ